MSKHPHIALLSLPGNFHCRKWAKALAQAGARVTVLSFEAAEPSAYFEQEQLDAPLSFGGRYRYPSYWLSAKALRQKLDALQVDIVYAMGITPFGSWARLSGFRPLTVAALGADVFDYLPEHATHPSWNRTTHGGLLESIRKWYFHRAVRRTLDVADLITADNSVLQNALKEQFGVAQNKTHLIRWGLDTDLVPDIQQRHQTLQQLALTDAPIVLSPRGLLPIYQPQVILESFAQLAPQHPETQFVLLTAGYDTNKTALANARQLAQQHPNVHLIAQRLAQSKSYALMAASRVMLSLPHYDGFSAAVNEALYLGALPLLSNTPSAQELAKDGAKLTVLQPLSVDTLTSHIEALLKMPEAQRQTIAAHNRAWVQREALLSTSAHQYLNVIQSLLKNR